MPRCFELAANRPILYASCLGAVQAFKEYFGEDFGQALFRFEVDDDVVGLCYNPQNDTLIIGTKTMLTVISGKSGLPLAEHHERQKRVEYDCMKLTHHSQLLVVGARDKHLHRVMLRIWKFGRRGSMELLHEEVLACEGSDVVQCMEIDPDDSRVFVGRNSGTVSIFHLNPDGNVFKVWEKSHAHTLRVVAMRYCPDTELLFTAGMRRDETSDFVQVWHVPSHLNCAEKLPGLNTDEVSTLEVLPSDRLIFMGLDNPSQEQGVLHIYRYSAGPWRPGVPVLEMVFKLGSVNKPSMEKAINMKVDTKQRLLLVGAKDEMLKGIKITSTGCLGQERLGKSLLGGSSATCLAYDPKNFLLLQGDKEGCVRAFQAKGIGTMGEVGSIKFEHRRAISCMALNMDYELLIVCDHDSLITSWRVKLIKGRGGTRAEFELLGSNVKNPDPSNPNPVKKKMNALPDSRMSVTGLEGYIVCMASDWRRCLLFTGSWRGTMRVWKVDAATGALDSISQVVQGDCAIIRSLQFAGHQSLGLTNELLLSGGDDGCLEVWSVSAEGECSKNPLSITDCCPQVRTYLVDNSKLKSRAAGLMYRSSRDMTDIATGFCESWGGTVQGSDEGGGWLRVIPTPSPGMSFAAGADRNGSPPSSSVHNSEAKRKRPKWLPLDQDGVPVLVLVVKKEEDDYCDESTGVCEIGWIAVDEERRMAFVTAKVPVISVAEVTAETFQGNAMKLAGCSMVSGGEAPSASAAAASPEESDASSSEDDEMMQAASSSKGGRRMWQVQVWSFADPARLKLLKRHPFGLVSQESKTPLHVRFLPTKRVLATCGAGTTGLELWRVSEDGDLRQKWFPTHIYRGDTTVVELAPEGGPVDKYRFIWLCSEHGRTLAVSEREMSERSLVRTLEVDGFLGGSFIGWWLPPFNYYSKIGMLAVCFLQMLAFSTSQPQALAPILSKPATALEKMKSFNLNYSQTSEFGMACGTTVLSMFLFMIQEPVEEWALLSPESICPFLCFVILDIFLMTITSVAILPLMVALLQAFACKDGLLEATSKEEVPIKCFSAQHLFTWVAASIICILMLGYLGWRLTRVRWMLPSIQLKVSNVMDWSGDAKVPAERMPRTHPLEYNDVEYDAWALIAKMLMACSGTIVYCTPWPDDVKAVVISSITLFAGLLLVRAGVRFNRFFIAGPWGALRLPLSLAFLSCGRRTLKRRLEPNHIQFAMDCGVCWSYLCQLAASVVLFKFSDKQAEALRERPIFAILPLLVPIVALFGLACRLECCYGLEDPRGAQRHDRKKQASHMQLTQSPKAKAGHTQAQPEDWQAAGSVEMAVRDAAIPLRSADDEA